MTSLPGGLRVPETVVMAAQASHTCLKVLLAMALMGQRTETQLPGCSPEHFVFLFRQVWHLQEMT